MIFDSLLVAATSPCPLPKGDSWALCLTLFTHPQPPSQEGSCIPHGFPS